MSKCKLCNKDISDGKEFCDQCSYHEEYDNNNLYGELLSELLNTDTIDNYSADITDLIDKAGQEQVVEVTEMNNDITESKDQYTNNDSGVNNVDDIDTGNSFDEVDELLNLLNRVKNEDPIKSDLEAISDLLNNVDNINTGNVEKNNISDVGDVFSDALMSVSNLKDPIQDEGNLLISDIDDGATGSKKNNKKSKRSIWAKIFGNKKEDKPVKDINLASNNLDNELALTEDKPDKKKRPKKSKKKKKVQDSLVTINIDAEDNVKESEAINKKESKKVSKKESKKASKKAKTKDNKKINTKENKKVNKKGKKIKVKKVKETKKIAVEEDQGKINPIGASLVLTFCGILLLFILAGTQEFSYSLNIENANKYFDNHEYTKAFNEVYGINVKDEDVASYNKIMTVMYVNKQLNSYHSYYSLQQYSNALDSLLKGLQRYDKYIELGTLLGIEEDLNYVKDIILVELDKVFLLSEDEAKQILNSGEDDMYSARLKEIVSDKKSWLDNYSL